MRILTIEELIQVTGGGLSKEQKAIAKSSKAAKKAGCATSKSAKSSSGKCTKSGSGSGSGKGTCLPPQ